MLYVVISSWQPGLTREQRESAMARRAQWQYPEGMKLLGEYWCPAEDLATVLLIETDDYAPIMEATMAWSDIFRITVHPAVTAEQGLQLGAALLARRGA